MTSEQKSTFCHARRHGMSLLAAARKAKLSEEQAHRLEGRRFCADCGDYVRDVDCVHWDYES